MQDVEQAIAYISENSEYEEIDNLKIAFAAYLMRQEEIIQSTESNEIGEEQADVAIVDAIETFAQLQLDIFDLELDIEFDEEDEEVAYNRPRPQQFASFGQECGEVLATLIEEQYEDPEEGIEDVANIGGISIADVVGIIDGDVVINSETAERIGGLFDSLTEDPEAMEAWMACCRSAYGEAMAGNGDRIAMAQMSRIGERTRQLEAKFNQMETGYEASERLKELMREADRLIAADQFTPADKNNLFGTFDGKEDRFVAFSRACEATGISMEQQIDRIEAVLHHAATTPPRAMFGQVSDGWGRPEELDKDAVAYASELSKKQGF